MTANGIDTAGRACPLRYRYGAQALANAPPRATDTLYVIGGLYGNVPALDTIEQMAASEAGPVTLCFNGDFNWFNVDDEGFRAINQRVLSHQAILGNVEAELSSDGNDAGCGCAYPEQVDAAVVERSNRIHARLKATARRNVDLTQRFAQLSMFARFEIGRCGVGVVHGDADSLAGWRFGADEIDRPDNEKWLHSTFDSAQVDVFSSTHTCEPVLKLVARGEQRAAVINNGAAGMPNVGGRFPGLITRIALTPSPFSTAYGTCVADAHIDAVPVVYDQNRWMEIFVANWPARSDAHLSYFSRITSHNF
ncbi:hypothetical protein [Paracidovorax sp. MALMAid1276]|uniref:hypothetical protein n=1 Tax=Paracidovorax sp. MALMAid1276 TaxID=3411631 RepID=UPI003B9AAB8B